MVTILFNKWRKYFISIYLIDSVYYFFGVMKIEISKPITNVLSIKF